MRQYTKTGKVLIEAMPGDWVRWGGEGPLGTDAGQHYVVESIDLDSAYLRHSRDGAVYRVPRSNSYVEVVTERRAVVDEVYLNLYTGIQGGQLRASAWPSRESADRATAAVKRTGLIRVTTEDDKPVKVELL